MRSALEDERERVRRVVQRSRPLAVGGEPRAAELPGVFRGEPQHEIATAQSDLGGVEEKVLELMLEADTITADVKRTEAALTTRQKEIDKEKKELTEELASVDTSLKAASEARAELVKDLDARLMAIFEQVARVRKGVAISTATRDGLCAACHVRLRPFVFQQIRQNDAIIQCESCHRILYWIPPPPPIEHAVVHT